MGDPDIDTSELEGARSRVHEAVRSLVAREAERLVGSRSTQREWMTYDVEDGWEGRESEEDAVEAARVVLSDYRDRALGDGEWPEAAEHLRVGYFVETHRTRFDREDEAHSECSIEPTPQASEAERLVREAGHPSEAEAKAREMVDSIAYDIRVVPVFSDEKRVCNAAHVVQVLTRVLVAREAERLAGAAADWERLHRQARETARRRGEWLNAWREWLSAKVPRPSVGDKGQRDAAHRAAFDAEAERPVREPDHGELASALLQAYRCGEKCEWHSWQEVAARLIEGWRSRQEGVSRG